MRERRYFVYMLASKPNGTLYVGVTNDLDRHLTEHREGAVDGFTRRHKIDKLVWFEAFDSVEAAIQHEKRLKRWRRDWKTALIKKQNPAWRDLADDGFFWRRRYGSRVSAAPRPG